MVKGHVSILILEHPVFEMEKILLVYLTFFFLERMQHGAETSISQKIFKQSSELVDGFITGNETVDKS